MIISLSPWRERRVFSEWEGDLATLRDGYIYPPPRHKGSAARLGKGTAPSLALGGIVSAVVKIR